MAARAFFWAQRGHYAEAVAWEARALGDASADGGGALARARWGCAYARFYGGDIQGAYDRATVALDEARAAGDDSTVARCLHTINTAILTMDPAGARPGLLQAVALARAGRDQWCEADAMRMVAYSDLIEGDYQLAEPVPHEAFAIVDRLGKTRAELAAVAFRRSTDTH